MSLRIITNSELKCRRRCAREHHYAYNLGYRPLGEDAEALRFGDAFHRGLEVWWLALAGGEESRRLRVEAAVATAVSHVTDPYEAAKLRVLLRGYDARWGDEQHDVVDVEAEFRALLRNPETGAASRTFVLAGKLDVLLRRKFVEHKTTSEEIGPGSLYWRRLTLDSQVSTYYAGAKALGHEVDGCIYDVVRKPALRPLKATPVESRKYTKDGRLYAAQREQDETPEEYEARLTEEVAANPDKYYQRGEVVRLEADEREAAQDTWQIARALREDELAARWPRNPDSCMRYGRVCPYFDVCTGVTTLNDMTRFGLVSNVHPELSVEAAE